MSKTAKPVTVPEMERDLLAFIAHRYAGRHLDVDTARHALAGAAHQLIFMHLQAVASEGAKPC
jgi:hypothetical protein